MQEITVMSKARDCFIVLTHRRSDPGMWIVRRWKKFLWFKKRISSDWFMSKQGAIDFANKLKGEFEAQSNHRRG